MKATEVDFTADYSNKSGSTYHLAHQTQGGNSGIKETSTQTQTFEFDNRSGSSAQTKTWALLLTHVVNNTSSSTNNCHQWGSFKNYSYSWATYYYKYVTFNSNGGTGTMSQQTVVNSASLTANAFTREGYTFAGWATSENGDVVYANGAEITATSDSKGPVTLYAQWTRNEATLNHSEDNSSFISSHAGEVYDITLTRTLNAGGWNTFCAPFDISSSQIASLFGEETKVRALGSSAFNSTTKVLTLNFTYAESIEAGNPYLIYLGSGSNVVNPTFNDVTIVNGTTTTSTTYVNFIPVMNPTYLTGGDKTVLFVTGGNELTYPAANGNINGFRAYFKLKDDVAASARTFTMSFDDGGTTEVKTLDYLTISPFDNLTISPFDNSVYDLQGRRVQNPKHGLYIVNGHKVVIK